VLGPNLLYCKTSSKLTTT